MPPIENRFTVATGDTQPPNLRETKSGRFEKHAMHAEAKKKLGEFCTTGDIRQLAIWKKEIVKWHNGGMIILEFDEWQLVPEQIRDIESPERFALLLMLAEDVFPSIEIIRLVINAITELQEITEWTELSPTTRQNLIYDLLKSIIESGSSVREIIIAKLTQILTNEVILQNTLPPDSKNAPESPSSQPIKTGSPYCGTTQYPSSIPSDRTK